MGIDCVAKTCPELAAKGLKTGVSTLIRTVLELGRATADDTDRTTASERARPKPRDDDDEDVGKITAGWLVVEGTTETRVREDDARVIKDINSPIVDIACEAADEEDGGTGRGNVESVAEDNGEGSP